MQWCGMYSSFCSIFYSGSRICVVPLRVSNQKRNKKPKNWILLALTGAHLQWITSSSKSRKQNLRNLRYRSKLFNLSVKYTAETTGKMKTFSSKNVLYHLWFFLFSLLIMSLSFIQMCDSRHLFRCFHKGTSSFFSFYINLHRHWRQKK